MIHALSRASGLWTRWPLPVCHYISVYNHRLTAGQFDSCSGPLSLSCPFIHRLAVRQAMNRQIPACSLPSPCRGALHHSNWRIRHDAEGRRGYLGDASVIFARWGSREAAQHERQSAISPSTITSSYRNYSEAIEYVCQFPSLHKMITGLLIPSTPIPLESSQSPADSGATG